MKRTELDALLSPHHLAAPDVSRALTLTGNRPSGAEWRAFASRSLGLGGIAALGAGLIFFIAANWQAMGAMGRFELLQAVLIVCVGIAWWFAPKASNITAATLILATLASGTLLALFGQTYQTGADVYELFFMWALLTLPFAIAGMSGALWAVWWCILNVALALFCGWHGPGDFVWGMFDRWGLNKPTALMLPFAVNLAGAALAYGASMTRHSGAAPSWLVRLLLTFAFGFGTSACVLAILPEFSWHRGFVGAPQNLGVLATFVAACVCVGGFALHQRRDVYPLALVAACAIAVASVYLVMHVFPHDLRGAFLSAVWLIAISTAAGFLLMRCVRAWSGHERVKPQTGEPA
jgi:Predicted membrane protein (DUF2157)